MYILHIETSTSVCSVALSKGDELISYRDVTEGMNHTAMLTPAIQDLLAGVGLQTKDLSAISVSAGPGSYTGLRVGGATAKAMAYALDKPLVAISTLTALAHAAFLQYPKADFALPMIDARRNEVYTALYDRTLREIWPVSSVILDEAFFTSTLPSQGKIVICGDGAKKIDVMAEKTPHLIIDPDILCSARHLHSLAISALSTGKVEDPLHYVPFYMKPPNITQSKKMVLP